MMFCKNAFQKYNELLKTQADGLAETVHNSKIVSSQILFKIKNKNQQVFLRLYYRQKNRVMKWTASFTDLSPRVKCYLSYWISKLD